MLDFLPLWLKSLIGTVVIVFIAIQGFRLTSKSGGNGGNVGGSSNKKESSSSDANKE